jgi:hypothetical protein
MKINKENVPLCERNMTELDIDNFRWFIERDYHYTFYIDDLPSAYISKKEETPTVKYENGIPIGTFDDHYKQYLIYNHLEFIIQIHDTLDDKESFRIVGFKVEPRS